MTSRPIGQEAVSPIRRSIAVIGLLAAALALASCDDAGVSGPTDDGIAGTYAAATTPTDGEIGEIVIRRSGSTERNLVLDGAGVTLVLHEDGTTSGGLSIPSSSEPVVEPGLEADLTGRWRTEEGVVRLDLDADVFLEDLDLALVGDALVGEGEFSETVVRVRLARVVGLADPDRAPDAVALDELVFEAELEVAESFHNPPQQAIQGVMKIMNRGDEGVTFDVGGCPIFLAAVAEDGRTWEQRNEVVCILILRRVSIDPGETVELRTPVAFESQILGDPLVGGTYRFSVVLPMDGDAEISVEAGRLELGGTSFPR